jgi:SAM-dependent methyltransferase
MKICPECKARFSGPAWRCPHCHRSPVRREGFLIFAPEMAYGNDGFHPESHEKLANLEDGSFWFRSRNKVLQLALRKHFPSAANLLELGCGTGYTLRGLSAARPSMSLVGADLYLSALKFAAKRLPEAEFIQLDARHIPFENEFDVVGSFDVLEHIEDDFVVIKNMYKALRPGGGLIITVPQHKQLWSTWDDVCCHKQRYSRIELISKVEAAGFRIIWITSFFTLLLPMLVASKLWWRRHRISDNNFYGSSGLRLPWLIDALLERVCDLERRFLKTGGSLPAGGSLLCVGQKD